jgi:hypothetical protein
MEIKYYDSNKRQIEKLPYNLVETYYRYLQRVAREFCSIDDLWRHRLFCIATMRELTGDKNGLAIHKSCVECAIEMIKEHSTECFFSDAIKHHH